MKKREIFWIVIFVAACLVAVAMAVFGGTAKTEKTTEFKLINRSVDSGINYKELYTDYGAFKVNWYYEDDGLYHVVFNDGFGCWTTKAAIAEAVANINNGD